MDTEFLVVGNVGGVGRVAPGGHLLGGDTHGLRRLGVAQASIGGGVQIVRRHQIREHVVADDRRVLVGTGDPVEVPDAVAVVVPEREPQPGGLDQHRKAAFLLQRTVAGDDAVAVPRTGAETDVERREECQGAVGEGSNVQMRSQIVAQGAGKPPLVRTEVRVPVSLGDLYEVLGELGWPGKARADEGDLGDRRATRLEF